MVLATKGSFFCRVTNFDHKIDQVLNRKHVVVQDWVLAVDSLDERPEFVYQLNIMRVHPEIRREHQVQEELFTESGVIDQETKLSQQLDGLAINRDRMLVCYRQSSHDLKQKLEEA